VQSHGQERKVFVRSHPKIVWSAKRGHLSFNAEENLLWGCAAFFSISLTRFVRLATVLALGVSGSVP
jgi:hypothetical protein